MKTPSRPRNLDAALLVLRLVVGAVFVFHGAQKLFGAFGGPGIEGFAGYLGSLGVPAPLASAWLAALAEFVGGLALLVGYGVRIASLPLVATMLVASFTAHAGKFSISAGGMEYTLVLATVALALGLTGAGSYSLEAWRRSPARSFDGAVARG